MSQTVALLFAFLTLIAIGIIVAGFVRNPTGTQQFFTSTIGSQGLGSYLNTLSAAQGATPGAIG